MRERGSGSFDAAVVGGGLVGASVAYGLLRQGLSVVILDEGDIARRASRGNFALVWVQSKGMGMPAYGAWTRRSSDIWADFAAELRDRTGVDVAHHRPGGFTLVLSEAEFERRRAFMERLQSQPGWEPFPYEMLDRAQVQKIFPDIGPEVAGASFTPLDGHVNSLRLFRALHSACADLGVDYRPGRQVERIEPRAGGGFHIALAGGEVVEAGKLVLTAGVGNARLAPMVGLEAPVRPQRGQVIVTEKTRPFLPYPLVTVRQTDEGGVMMGDSSEEVEEDARVGLGVLGTMADRAVRMFPLIGRLNVVRTWSALRVMTRDGFPIYDESESAPGAFLCTCHSGVTLAAVHALELAPMIAAGRLQNRLSAFTARRFHVPAPA